MEVLQRRVAQVEEAVARSRSSTRLTPRGDNDGVTPLAYPVSVVWPL